MEKIKERVTHYGLYVTAMLKWLAVGALVLVGAGVTVLVVRLVKKSRNKRKATQ